MSHRRWRSRPEWSSLAVRTGRGGGGWCAPGGRGKPGGGSRAEEAVPPIGSLSAGHPGRNPIAGPRTGIARHVQGLLDGLTRLPEPPEIVLTAFTGRGRRQLAAPPGCSVAGRPVPARVLGRSGRTPSCYRSSGSPARRTSSMPRTSSCRPPGRRWGLPRTTHTCCSAPKIASWRPSPQVGDRIRPNGSMLVNGQCTQAGHLERTSVGRTRGHGSTGGPAAAPDPAG